VIDMNAGPNVSFQIDAGDEFYRMQLPAIAANARTHAGRWTAVLKIRDLRQTMATIGLKRFDPGETVFANVDRQALAALAARGALPYQLFVQSYSNLRMTADVQQSSFRPGATLSLLATLKEYRVPLIGPARVVVEITAPDGSESQVPLTEVSTGQFSRAHTAIQTGLYRCRFRATGTTRAGRPFQREETRTVAINARLGPGGDLAPTGPVGSTADDDERRRWCALVSCLLQQPSIVRLLEKNRIDRAELATCLKRYCRTTGASERSVSASLQPQAGEESMSEDTEKVLSELAKLRAELRKDATLDSLRWEELLTPSPEAKAVPAAPVVRPHPVGHEDHEAHHTRALPALVTDDEGKTSVMIPPGHEAEARRAPAKPHEDRPHEHRAGEGHRHDEREHDHDEHDHSHDEHDHGGHDHGEPGENDDRRGRGESRSRPKKK
jgi:hypothetical protein